MKMTEEVTSPLYDLWSKFYDYTFGALVHQRQIKAVQQLKPKPGETILDLGVGTGMTLKYYPRDINVVGMDLSEGMLSKAAKKIESEGLKNCFLIQGDAMNPPFAENSFDHVMITHVVTVVSDPAKLMAWARRMVKPGGRIVVLNHFLSTNPFIAWWERVTNPIFVKIGWRSDLSLEDCLKDSGLTVQYNFKLARLDLWQIVVLGEEGNQQGKPFQPRTDDVVTDDGPAGKSHTALAID